MNDEVEPGIDWRTSQQRQAEGTPSEAAEPQLAVHVVVTSTGKARKALEAANRLAGDLNCRLVALVPEVVPFPLPLDKPAVPAEFRASQMLRAFEGTGVAAEIRLVMCRAEDRALLELLKPRSLVVISASGHWWPTRESRLAKSLRKAGHHVFVIRER